MDGLLTGFTSRSRPIRPEIDRLLRTVNRIEGYTADTADSMRRLLRAADTEVTDCPHLFTLTQESPAGARRLAVHERHYRLVLWCEFPGGWHPWPDASYAIGQPRKWLLRIMPYAAVVLKILRVAVPIAEGMGGIALSASELERARLEFEALEPLTDGFPVERTDYGNDVSAGQLTLAEGEGLRALRQLLFEHDRTRRFGGLRRVQAKTTGDYLWLCPEHFANYDRGLPPIEPSDN